MNIIEAIERKGDFVMFEDGFIYYCPSKGGGLAAHHLREIADELDRRNKDWEEQMTKFFEERSKNEI